MEFLVDRQSPFGLDAEGWSLLFAEARSCGLLSRIAAELPAVQSSGMPANLILQVNAAKRQGESLISDVVRELGYLDKALKPIKAKGRVILLKGAAYVAAGLPAANGRIFSDIDILVTHSILAETEGALMLGGWAGRHLDQYDQRYYREWSHEVPPMMHHQRGTTIDLHHSLVMPTCRIHIDSERMIADSVAIPGAESWYRLKDEDLVLHAASHLLLNSELDRSLRDLWDIEILVSHFSRITPNFPDGLLARAEEVGLGEIAGRALVLCKYFFHMAVPERAKAKGRLLMPLLICAAYPRHPDTRPHCQGVADFLLFLRELSIRLPPQLLIRHLWHKATSGGRARESAA